ncbi:MAG: TetR/AcrR family transcriptional regulator [Actinobacteria bacterium]|nr:TetR/AcrR family transcriptional regulator [Actinomycetota bacterium]
MVDPTPAQRARRQRIVRSALELLEQRPYDQIQIRDVAERADVALGTLYRYFPSKEQLFAHVLLEWSSSFADAIGRRRPERDSDAERLRTALRRAVGAFERNPNFFQLITVLEVATDPDVVAPFTEYSDAFIAVVEGAMRDTDEAQTAVVVGLAIALLWSLLREWSHDRCTIREVNNRIDASIEVVFEGARTR